MANTGTSLWPLLNQAENLIQQGDQRGARALFEQAMNIASAADDPWMTWLTYIRSGTTEVRLGEIERALLYFGRGTDALRREENLASPPAEAAPLLQSLQQELASPEMAAPTHVRGLSRLAGGMAARRTGKLALAEAELREALPLLAQDGDSVNMAAATLELAGCLSDRGDVAFDSGRLAEAKDFYNRSFELYSQSGHMAGEAKILLGLGNVLREEGDPSSAYSYYTKAARRARGQGNSGLMGRCHVETAQLCAMNGRVPEAQWNLTCARALFAQSDTHLVSDVDTTLANIRSYNPAAYDQLARAFKVQGLGDIWSLTPP
jgi:tetratricopeptide (TPR) repeat protein